MAQWYIYIVSNHAHTLYTGMTDNLPKRVSEHQSGRFKNAFTARYTFDRLVYYEGAANQTAAARREKQIKNWPRAKRVALIQSMNPNWNDLYSRFDFARWFR
jgi:putative endonuclease